VPSVIVEYILAYTYRVANSPVFPGMSRISADMSRVLAIAVPGRIMSRFSAGL
jgi:hypothetical protein